MYIVAVVAVQLIGLVCCVLCMWYAACEPCRYGCRRRPFAVSCWQNQVSLTEFIHVHNAQRYSERESEQEWKRERDKQTQLIGEMLALARACMQCLLWFGDDGDGDDDDRAYD